MATDITDIRTHYAPQETEHVADNGVTYVVQSSGNSWFLAPYREQGSVASYEHAKVAPKGTESVNASPPNTGTGATGFDITPPTTTRHLYTSQYD
jgi:hypothetical protein